jgi:hypothetical protein
VSNSKSGISRGGFLVVVAPRSTGMAAARSRRTMTAVMTGCNAVQGYDRRRPWRVTLQRMGTTVFAMVSGTEHEDDSGDHGGWWRGAQDGGRV